MGHKYVVIAKRSSSGNAWAVFIILALLFAFWQWILIGGLLALSVFAARHAMRLIGEQRAVQAHKQAALASRADEQNAMFLAGDPRGIFGVVA